MQNKVNIVFPIEIVNRELPFRLLLASLCAHAGNRIFIGEHNAIYRLLPHLQNGIYLGKNIFPTGFPGEQQRFAELKKRGFTHLHLEEEGAVYTGAEADWQRQLDHRLDPRILSKDDRVFAWGNFQRDYYRSFHPACEANIIATGHPRFDVYKPEFRTYFDDEVRDLRARYGEFLLINTNFLANIATGFARWFRNPQRLDPQNIESRTALIGNWNHSAAIWGNFLQLINRLSHELPDLQIVVRPHPIESVDNYNALFENFPNVRVVHEGHVGAWLLACRAMIHDGCTTAIEAHFAGTPIINYKSVSDTRYDLYLPNVLGAQCRSEDEVLYEIARVRRGETTSLAAQEIPVRARNLLANFESEAFGAIRDATAQAESLVTPGAFDARGWAMSYKLWRGRRAVRSRVKKRNPNQTKFYPFTATEIETKLAAASRATGKTVRHSLLSEEMLLIEAD